MTEAEYSELPGLRSSHIKAGEVSMLAMRHAMTTHRPDTAALAMGRLVHTAAFEPAKLADVAVWRGGRRAGAEWDAWKADHAGHEQCTAADMDLLDVLSGSVRSNPDAAKLLAGCQYETCQQWSDAAYGAGKCRFDAVKPRTVVELKTIASLTTRAAESAVWRYGYHIQLGWYCEGYLRSRGEKADAWIVWVEKSPPYDCAVQQIGFDTIDHGQRKALNIASRYHACEEAGIFPGVQESMVVLGLPFRLQEEYDEMLCGRITEDDA